MKKIHFVWIFVLILAFSSCKKKDKDEGEDNTPAFEVYRNGDLVNNNATFTFNTNDAVLNLVIKNTSSSTIHLKTHLVNDSSGNNGAYMEFCFGNCYVVMDPGTTYPLGSTLDIEAGAQTADNAIHYINHYGNDAVSYTIEIYAVDEAGNKNGDPFTFIYKYQP